ncbi:Do family serine endopeptidase [Oceanospirillum sediminis]|uniref:Do family serine endopeptidase n=1 Tax=Oceanospirillum sediminis TaxID=2760088 RepID=A0A839ILB9_9GAMM|nr:Do family serine endopeptidase [Oceanospirillum sediminis]MBB1485504.1 Do family serine endopeptidase [Oceanospirillum sediminis]
MKKLLRYLSWPVLVGAIAGLYINQQTLLNANQPGSNTPVFIEAAQAAQSPRLSGPYSYSDAVKQAAPAVVNIYTSKIVQQRSHPLLSDPAFRQFFGYNGTPRQERMQSSLGSGVIISTDGYILTNNHVIAGADEIKVALKDGRETIARVVGTDPETDLAVLRIPLKELPVITIAPSDALEVGDVVLAIGNPFGVGQTVTMGIVSATGRDQLGINTFEDFIQTDAAINPGNSGGALVNPRGELVGINTAIFSKSGGSQGIGFAIPSDLARQIMVDIVREGSVVRGWLGVEVQDLTPQLARSFGYNSNQGIVIAGLLRNGPAHRAGMQPGDIVIAVEGQPVISSQGTMNQIAQKRPGESISLTVFRQGKRYQLTAEVGRRPVPQRQ